MKALPGDNKKMISDKHNKGSGKGNKSGGGGVLDLLNQPNKFGK